MAKNISLLGATFTGVTGVTLPQQGGGTVTFPEVSPTTATESDVASGKVFFKSDGTQSTGTASGGGGVLVVDTTDVHGGTIREITAESQLTHRDSSDLTASEATVTVPSGYYAAQATKSVTTTTHPNPTVSVNSSGLMTASHTQTTGYVTGGTTTGTSQLTTKGATTYHPSTSNQTIASGTYLTGTQTVEAVTYSNTLTAANIVSGVVIKVGSATDDDCIVSVTGTASGGGKNAQAHESTTRATSSSYTSCNSLTCNKAGTYTVYYSCMRSSTGGTNGSQLYIGGSAYGTADTANWSNHVQNKTVTGVSIAKNDTVAVYARSRGSNYYAYVPLLTIIEE